MRETRIQFPWWLRRFVEGVIRRRLEEIDSKVPITFFFQLGKIKGRLIVDDLI